MDRFIHQWTIVCAVVLAAGALAVRPARAQASPDFDAAPWVASTCSAPELTQNVTPAEVNLVGDAAFPAFYVAQDATYLYLRLRLDGSPAGTRGFARSAWTVLVQSPTGNPFQHQFQLSLNGEGPGGDAVEIWENDPALDFDFANVPADDAETRLFAQIHDLVGPDTVNTTPLARTLEATDGSSFKNTPDHFLDFAFPVATLVASGVVADPEEVGALLLFPATATRSNRHNKDWLNCPFLPARPLNIDVNVAPGMLTANAATPVAYTIVVANTGAGEVRGLTVTDPELPPYLSGVTVDATASDPGVVPQVVSTNPPVVRVASLPPGATLTVQVAADALPGCGAGSFVNVVRAAATNATEVSDAATLTVEDAQATEVCDGLDNDCDGQTDEGTAAECDDGDLCNGIETCGGQAGCQPGPPLDCGDGDPCTTDACAPATGCAHTPIPGCTGCTSAEQCSDGNACTTDDCVDSSCTNTPVPDCMPCLTAADCADSTSCTTEQCTLAGTCLVTAVPGCQPCVNALGCNDQNACTTDTCTAGACGHVPISGCGTCVAVPEACTDDADNDCDGAEDCADDDCAGVPPCAPPPEVCGNCEDDDGDGRVDYEDADCCAAPRALTVEQLMLRPTTATAQVHGDRLRLEAVYAPIAPALFDPRRQDTSVQLSDAGGPLFCATLPAVRWFRSRGLAFRVADPFGEFGGGLARGRFVVNRLGEITFRTRGRGMSFRTPADASVRVTVRVGGECSQSTATLRARRQGLVFP